MIGSPMSRCADRRTNLVDMTEPELPGPEMPRSCSRLRGRSKVPHRASTVRSSGAKQQSGLRHCGEYRYAQHHRAALTLERPNTNGNARACKPRYYT